MTALFNGLHCDERRTYALQSILAAICLIALLAKCYTYWSLGHGELRSSVLVICTVIAAFFSRHNQARSIRGAIVVMSIGAFLAALSLGADFRVTVSHGVFHSSTMLITVSLACLVLAVFWPGLDDPLNHWLSGRRA